MNPLAILAIVVVVLGAGAAVEGKLLLDAHEKMGDLKVQVKERDGIIKLKEQDADFSAKLAGIQTLIEQKLRTVGNDTRQAITNANTDDGAAAGARAGVLQLRSDPRGSRPPSP